VATLVLTHLMPGPDPERVVASVQRDFTRRVLVAEDLLEV